MPSDTSNSNLITTIPYPPPKATSYLSAIPDPKQQIVVDAIMLLNDDPGTMGLSRLAKAAREPFTATEIGLDKRM